MATSEEIDADFDAWMEGEEWDVEPGAAAPPPEDADGVNRLLRRVRNIEQQIDRYRSKAEPEISRLQAWLDDRTSGLRKAIAFTERSLETWMRAHYEATGVKTEKLPNGELMVRPAKPRLVVTDEQAAVVFAVSRRAEWIRWKLEIAKDPALTAVVEGPTVVGPEEAEDGYEWREARLVQPDGSYEIVPGLVLLAPTAKHKRFSYKTTKQEEHPV